MKYEEIIKNRHLSEYADTKDAVIQNYLKSIPANSKRHGTDKPLHWWL